MNVEQIDDEFVDARFGYDDGNLYKCAWGANLKDDGQINNNDIYELKTNKKDNDRTILTNFVKVLNDTSDEEFEQEIEKVFNVPSYIRHLAVEVLTGHWDGYSYNKNNYYLYENEGGIVEFIPYDVDNTFGIDWVDRDWGIRDVLDWPNHGDARPLTQRILNSEKYLSDYKSVLDTMLSQDFSEAYFFQEFDKYQTLLADAFSRDTYFPLTFGFSYNDFENSDTQQVIAHAPYGLKPYIATRTTTALEQINTITAISASNRMDISLYPNPSNGNSVMIMSNDLPNQSSMVVIDMQGAQINYAVSFVGTNSYKLEFDNYLSPGIYVLLIEGSPAKFMVR